MTLTEEHNLNNMSDAGATRVPCSRVTRDVLRAQKRGGESYDELLRKMIEQYDPEPADSDSVSGETAKGRG